MQDPAKPGLTQTLVSAAAMLVVMGVLLFWPAGTLAWPRGWWFIAVFLACMLAAILVLWRFNPEIFAARSGIAKGTKSWDYAFLVLIIGGCIAILPVAALDDARFRWAPTPDWVVILGYLLMIAGFAGTAWAQAVNRHFEPGVRIQTDRGHAVIDTGPYAVIRHPGYLFGSLMAVGVALALGSLWALIPAAVVVVTLVPRTLAEEATLRAELPGYTDYTQRVRYRWIPGVW
jgi:protein-S-isoprenylcysteine O-methyltransferase Ste14